MPPEVVHAPGGLTLRRPCAHPKLDIEEVPEDALVEVAAHELPRAAPDEVRPAHQLSYSRKG
eukprot:CAMPEP_0181206472 /NCGR_PEP_ID=MMETSP1096-20121128/21053_1 /TAXON_ID=156174 ORGANISM="Chrysochromulina ericina, Strain CCMP281" /NCGR_SAMPLE_ID=MMETSP1096 /ASSEMBLY_ACC=CAM_ASM_000453 /LENGTH=61 /DNA_ID=CAMNT_0023297373 /DNA_START=588 /DNA_END=773 /DNA_ORIENTATION=-